MGHLQQLHHAEDDTVSRTVRRIPAAACADGLLLLSHRLLATYQGNSAL